MFQGMRYVYEVYKERSFSKAAANLFVSQPSLSANVKRVEQRIGYPIFDRSTKPLGLTQCGAQYIRTVEAIMLAENAFADYIDDWSELKTGQLRVGGSSFFSSWVLPPLIADFSREFPRVQVSLLEENTVMLAQKLQQGQVDLVLDNCELDDTIFDRYILQNEHILLAVPRAFSVNERLMDYQITPDNLQDGGASYEHMPAVPMENFEGLPFIFMKPENDTGKRAVDICRENHITPNILFELDQQMTAYNVTCSGMGISFIGDMLISRVPVHPNVVYYKLPGDHCRRNVFFYWKRGHYMSRAMEEFIKRIHRSTALPK